MSKIVNSTIGIAGCGTMGLPMLEVLLKNNKIVQSSTTGDMLWGIDEIIAYVSQYFTLKIGDIIFTGTPSGVGKVQSNDSLKGYIGEEEFFSIKVK